MRRQVRLPGAGWGDDHQPVEVAAVQGDDVLVDEANVGRLRERRVEHAQHRRGTGEDGDAVGALDLVGGGGPCGDPLADLLDDGPGVAGERRDRHPSIVAP